MSQEVVFLGFFETSLINPNVCCVLFIITTSKILGQKKISLSKVYSLRVLGDQKK